MSELRGILNSGHAWANAFVTRCVGDDHEPRVFSTWCAKAVALIGNLPETLEDRSIVVRMRRKAPDENIERLRLGRLRRELKQLRRRIKRWVQDHLEELKKTEPAVPAELNDRQADNWRPLLAIADAAGWLETAQQAARVLAAGMDESETAEAVLLLADLHDLFEERGVDRLPSKEVVTALIEHEDRPWAEYRRGKPLTAVGLARLLRPFGVRPRLLWSEGGAFRGYDRADFKDVFERWLPKTPPFEALGALESPSDAASTGSPKPLGDRAPNTPSEAEEALDDATLTDLTTQTGGAQATEEPDDRTICPECGGGKQSDRERCEACTRLASEPL